MISLFYDDSNKVYLKYYEDLPVDLAKEKHLKVEVLEDPEEKEGKVAVLMANEKEYWYEYEDEPLDKEDEVEKQLQALADSQGNTEDLLQEIILNIYK